MSLSRTIIAALSMAVTLGGSAAIAETLRIGLVTPPPHQWTLSANTVAERLAAETDGRLKLSVFPAGQLGSEAQLLQQLQAGALDLAFLTVGELTNRDADFGALTAPYLVKDAEGAAKLLEGPSALALQEQLSGLGLKGLGWGMAGMRVVTMVNPLPASGTVAGLKIRTVPLAQELDFWTLAGAAPTPLPLPDLFDAFTNGQIDGMQIDLEGTFNTRYFDYSKAILDSRHMIFPMAAVASGRRWQTLSPEDQALIARVVGEETAKIRHAYPQIDESYRTKLREAGAPLLEAGPEIFGTAVEEWYKVWRTRTPILVDLEKEAAALR